MSGQVRELSLRVATLRLGEDDDIEARFPPAFGRIVIRADTVQVEGWIRLPGRELDICARCIEARPTAAGRPAVLDVSGRPAESAFDPKTPTPNLNGSPASPDGRLGRAGGAGNTGGRIHICVDRVQGELGLAANGGRGGDSERGGSGAKPATVNGVDGQFLPAKWPARGPYGGGVLQKAGLQKYVAWAAGAPGGDARTGGAAGAPGQPGRGGDGGEVRLGFSGPDAPVLATIVDGGAPGVPGLPAAPGAASAPGAGGRNRIYAYDIFGTDNDFARAGRNKVVDGFARKFKIAARAVSGKPGAGAGAVPPQPAATAGRAGVMQVAPVAPETCAAKFDVPFLRLLLAHADRDHAGGALAIARQRYAWLARLTDAMAPSDSAAADIWRAADAAIRALPADAADPPAQRARRGH